LASKTKNSGLERVQEEMDTVSLLTLFVLVHRTCDDFIHEDTDSDDFYHRIDTFIKNKLKSPTHKAIFTFIVNKFKKMNFELVKKECREIPKKIAEEDPDTYKVLVQYEISHIVR
jgi:hypothetical protein